MPFERVNIQLAIKLDAQGRLPEELRAKPTSSELTAIADMTYAQIFRAVVRKFQRLAEKINEGSQNEEMMIIAKRHTCTHDSDPVYPCVEEDI